MKVSKAMTIWIDYHNAHSKKNTVQIISVRHGSVLSEFRGLGDGSNYPRGGPFFSVQHCKRQ